MNIERASAFVISPSPGIGDFIVRIPAIKLLATQFNVTLICSLPEAMRAFAEMSLDDNQIELILDSSFYRKSYFGIMYGHLESLFYALRYPRVANFCILMTEQNNYIGIIKYYFISILSCRHCRRFSIHPLKGKFPLHHNISVQFDLQKMERFFNYAEALIAIHKSPTKKSLSDFIPQLRPLPKEPYVILAPGGKFKDQRWPYFIQLAKWLRNENIRTVIVGSLDEISIIEKVHQTGQEALVGENLVKITEIIRDSSLVVCNDSGLLHLSVLQGTRVVAICGPHFAATWTGYPVDRVSQLYEGDLNYNSDIEDGEYRTQCLSKISPERVIREVRRVLGLSFFEDL